MLSGLCRRLASDGWTVSMVGRGRAKLARAAGGDARVVPISVDYEDLDAFAAALNLAVAERGPIELAVCWIRSWAPGSLLAAAAAVAPRGRLVHVIGSQRGGASETPIAELRERDDLRYQQVKLGQALEAGRPRWLTDDEISAGVYDAIALETDSFLVGTTPCGA